MISTNWNNARNGRVLGASLALIFLAGLFAGGGVTYSLTSNQINSLTTDVSKLNEQISILSGFQDTVNESVNIYQNGTALSLLYSSIEDSIVLVSGQVSGGIVEGTGFVYNASGTLVVITNFHVIDGANNLGVTFSDGNGYEASVTGSDKYSDLAVLNVNAPSGKFMPITIVSSSTVHIGDLVVAVGNPYGLLDSLTMGVVSGKGRALYENTTGGAPIANIIQTSALLNPGNSGGPLLNYLGDVVGINTAVIQGSQGVCFAIPSDTLLREIEALIHDGVYLGHSTLGLGGVDMDYQTAVAMGSSITYGWLVRQIEPLGPSVGKLNIDDLLVAINGVRIVNGDSLATYLEEHTLPNDTAILTAVRNGQTLNINVTLGALQ